MSYVSRVTGRVAVTPPVPLSVLASSRFNPTARLARDGMVDVQYEVADQPGGDDAVRRVVVAIVPDRSGEYSFRDLAEHLAEAVAEIEAAGSTATGDLIRRGERQGDVERYRAADGRIWSEAAELRWPDGTPVGEL